MRLLTSLFDIEQDHRIIGIFGVGLVGTAIETALCASLPFRAQTLALGWSDGSKQEGQLDAIKEQLAESLAQQPRTTIDIIWSAGKAGFDATPGQTQSELENFRRVLNLAQSVSLQFPANTLVFHMFSSAGGLFEGRRHVTARATPTPRRPYGRLKLKQEKLVQGASAHIVKRIYRLGTAYSFIRPGQRRGLIATMIINGICHKVTDITGDMTTLRDFIFADDIGRYFVDALRDNNYTKVCKIQTLVSGKPSTVHEIQIIIEETINRRVYMKYTPDQPNRADISFSSNLIPPGLQITDTRQAIHRIYIDALSSDYVIPQHPVHN